MRGPTAERIELDEAARNALEQLERRYSTPQQIALRAQIVLKAAQGLRIMAGEIETRKWPKIR